MKRLKLTQWREEEEEEEEEHSSKGDDMISGLPNDVLTSILSLVPMKDAVKTSILSTRWRFLWALRSNLELDFSTIFGRSITKNSMGAKEVLQLLTFEYVGRVDKLLQLYRSPKVYSFKVSYYTDQESSCHLDRWIEFAIAMGVESLEINLPRGTCPLYVSRNWCKYYIFPCLLLSHHGKISSLKYLRLEFSTLECPHNFNVFNSLVTLELHEVELSESCLEIFFSSCLLLEILNMRKCKLPTDLKAVGPCVNLKCLDMSRCFGVNRILISASKLTSFRYCGGFVSFSLSDVPWLKKLFMRFWVPRKPDVLTQLPKDLPQLESLYLSLTTEMNAVPAKITSFSNLKHLELQIYSCPELIWIISTINALPRLVKLTLMFSTLPKTKSSIRTTSSCPHNHLKMLTIYGFRTNFQNGMELVFYLLKNCVALERMIIYSQWGYYAPDGEFITSRPKFEESSWQKVIEECEDLHEILYREVPDRAKLVTFIC